MNSDWKTPIDVKQTYVNASILKNGRIVIKIKRYAYRVIVKFNFEKRWAFIRFVGPHSDYEKIYAHIILKFYHGH